MPGFIREMFIVLELVLFCYDGALFIKCVSMNNQPCLVRPTLIDLNPDKHHYYPFIVSMSRCDGSCNTLEDPFGRICIPNKIKNLNLEVLNIIKGINESRTLAKHISCECRCEFDGRKCKTPDKT